MHPRQHNPEMLPSQFPASSPRLNGRATGAISRQLRRLETAVGDVADVRHPHDSELPLYGYDFTLSDGRRINVQVETDENHPHFQADQNFVEARHRAAVLRSRVRSKGSRRFNLGFTRGTRGNGPGGHGYQFERSENEYQQELAEFMARKLTSAGIRGDSRNQATLNEAVSRATIQEQRQMSALENTAAEQKSGHRFLNFMRNHKKSRFAVGVALAGVGALTAASGMWIVAAPVFAARAGLAATGGYLMGRTGHDAIQGRRANRLPHDDIRMAGFNNGDFSGRLTPQAAFERFVKINGAEARAGSHRPERQELARNLGSLVHQHYMNILTPLPAGGRGASTADRIRQRVNHMHHQNGIIGQLQRERLASDQTQSRRRHLAGIAGAVVVGSLPFMRLAGLIDPSLPIGRLGIGGFHPFGIFGHGGGGSEHAANAVNRSYNGGGSGARSNLARTALGNKTQTVVDIHTGSGNDTVNIDLQEHAHGHGLGAHHLHEALNGISTSELHVKPGSGFISTLQEQYHLTSAQADDVYQEMYPYLHGAPGTYMISEGDVGISSPGNFELPHGARTVLEEHLKAFHKMPEHLSGSPVHTGIAPEEARVGGAHAPSNAMLDSHGNLISQASTPTPGVTDIHLDTGSGNDTVNLFIPGGPMPEHIEAIINGQVVNETGLHGLSPEQAAQAQDSIANLIHNGKLTGLSPSAKSALSHYIESSLDRPVHGSAANRALLDLRHVWNSIHHNLDNLTPDEAQSIEEDLAVINAR